MNIQWSLKFSFNTNFESHDEKYDSNTKFTIMYFDNTSLVAYGKTDDDRKVTINIDDLFDTNVCVNHNFCDPKTIVMTYYFVKYIKNVIDNSSTNVYTLYDKYFTFMTIEDAKTLYNNSNIDKCVFKNDIQKLFYIISILDNKDNILNSDQQKFLGNNKDIISTIYYCITDGQ